MCIVTITGIQLNCWADLPDVVQLILRPELFKAATGWPDGGSHDVAPHRTSVSCPPAPVTLCAALLFRPPSHDPQLAPGDVFTPCDAGMLQFLIFFFFFSPKSHAACWGMSRTWPSTSGGLFMVFGGGVVVKLCKAVMSQVGNISELTVASSD